VPVFSDTHWLGWGAAFSPNGRWLSYVSPNAQEIQAYNLETGQTVRIPSRSGEPAVWDTQGDVLLVTDLLLDNEQFAVHLFRVDLATGTAVDLSGATAEVNDSLPAVSPDGRWIAVTRKVPRAPDGKQVWLLPSGGGEPTNLTARPEVHFGGVGWSENGRYLTFQGYELARPGAEPTVWLYDTATSELRSLVTPGTQPAWVH
jgi:Tol biopolymer transport system component